MLNSKKDIDHGPETKGNSIPTLKRLREAGETIVFTVNGKIHEVAPIDNKGFQLLVDLVERMETIEAIREGLGSIERGEGRPVEEFFAEMERDAKASKQA